MGGGSDANLTLMLVQTPFRITSQIQEANQQATHSTKRTPNILCEIAMKYFTPELYEQFNSFDVEEAERADEAWDKAELEYKERLGTIRKYMPSQIVKLSELCLHDALVVSRGEQTQCSREIPSLDIPYPFPRAFLWMAVEIISVTIGEEVVSLIYWLSDHPTKKDAPPEWRFSKLQEQWLYDEVDLIDEGRGIFVHRILFSTGVTLEIPFTSVFIHRFTLPGVSKLTKQSA